MPAPFRLLPQLTAALAALVFVPAGSAEIAVKSGEKIAFLGDSITEAGWSHPQGYVRLVIAGLAANGITAEAVPAGISGHKSDQMLARLDADVLSKKPQWMTLSCGVNDVWHGAKGVPLADYKTNITKLIEKAQAAGVKPVILTASVIYEKLDSPENLKLAPFNDFLREVAKSKSLPLADVNATFQERIKAEKKPEQNLLTSDGVHLNAEGNKVFATGVLQAFGLDAAALQKAQQAWAAPAKEPVAP